MKCFEWSNGLDTELYKKVTFTFCLLFQLAVASTINNELVMHVMSVCVDELSFFTKTYRGKPHDSVSAGTRGNMCVSEVNWQLDLVHQMILGIE